MTVGVYTRYMSRRTEQRFFTLIAPADECWEWQGNTNNRGYGAFWDGTKTALAHRWVYEFMVDDIPEGLDIDHLCRNRKCVNPEHLEPVTRSVNHFRKPKPIFCRSGRHLLSETGYVRKDGGGRACRACQNDRQRIWRGAK
jgi:hypothetical protein